MSSKRFAFGFVALLTVAIGAGFTATPPVAWSDWGTRGGPPPGHGPEDKGLGNTEQSRIRQGLDIAPVPLNFAGKDKDLVGLGSYLVNGVAGCSGCHTCPEYQPQDDPYHGGSGRPNATNYLAGGKHFGPFTSANITPRPGTGLPAGLTLEQFITFIRTGHDPEHGDLVQVMPWPIYRNMTERDLTAIYTYLTAIPSAQPGNCGP